MSSSGELYVQSMRNKGLSDDDIKTRLRDAGWSEADITAAFANIDDELAPPPPVPKHSESPETPAGETKPVAVVQQYSTRGIEYAIMFFSLGIGAIALGNLLHYLVNSVLDPAQGGSYFSAESVALPATAALVTIPIFTLLFLRLKRAEKAEQDLHKDSSRRKWIQVTLLVTFLWGIWAFVFNFYKLLLGNATTPDFCELYRPGIDGPDPSCITPPVMTTTEFIVLHLLHIAITLLIAGSIFAYWWIDEHRQK